ncbi:MAG TPA: alpha-ketoglutarate-dependent dioxygenase AlkB [Blastocatellia bacterium]|nr:alpha-ketoglutarate-dependent dioxygenase AlkB [Blastocatellia bacterium]
MNKHWQQHWLDSDHWILSASLPKKLRLDGDAFETLWILHPPDYHEIKIHGRLVKTPRWQQAYGADYYYTGFINRAQPIPPMLIPLHTWVKEEIDDRLNGLLVNWYDARLGHYIGPHRDNPTGLIKGSPIVTVSFGETRIFRLRPVKLKGVIIDFTTHHGTVFIMPWETNQAWKHEVPGFKCHSSRRISVTFRAFTASSS